MNTFQAIFALFDKLSKYELPNAIGYVHEPHVAPMYYRYIYYKPLDEQQLLNFQKSCNFEISEELIKLYKHCNGMRINQELSIFGSLVNRGLQPISLDYGNVYERPAGLPSNSTVIGGLHLTNDTIGYLVVHEDGSVTCTSSFLTYDEIRKWPDIETLVRGQITANL